MTQAPQSKTMHQRQKAYRFGTIAETLALIYLFIKGYRPLARRYGGKGGEIDLIMQHSQTIIFVEVKARSSIDDALSAITARKRMLMSRTAKKWLSENQKKYPDLSTRIFRADAVMLAPWRLPHHIENAFALDF